jgi:succinoglycan biosynthesis transport protein ExoP
MVSDVNEGATARDGAIDLGRLLGVLVARKWWILLPTLAALAAGFAFVTLVSPRYTAITRVVLESQESYFLRPEKATSDLTTPVIYDPEGVQGEAESVRTDEIARQAVRKLELTKLPEFNPSRGLFGMVMSLFGGRGDADAEDRAVDLVLTRLTVFPVVKTRILQIEFVSSDPKLAARIANTIAGLYIDSKEEAKRAATKSASGWLSGRIEELRVRAADADAKAEAYRAQTGLLAGAGGVTLPTQQLTEIAAQIAAARAAQSAAASKAQLLRQMIREGRLDAVPDVAKDDSLRHYAELRVNLKAEIAEQGRTLLPGHPHMKELEGQLAGLDGEIRAAATKAVRGLEDDAKLAGSQVASLEAQVAAQSKTVATGNGDEVRLRELELDAKTAKAQLESYIEKYHEAVAHEADDAQPADARVLTIATPPAHPTFPKKAPTLALSALAGFFLSLGVVLARALLIDEAVAPAAVTTRRPRAAESSPPPMQAATDELDAIVDRLAGGSQPGACLSVMVAADGAGVALAPALGAARRFSKLGSAVLLDLGASQPWLADTFDPAREHASGARGLADVLEGRAHFVDALHRDLSSTVDILPAGEGEIDAGGLAAVIDVLSQSYAFVVIHASDWRAPAALAGIENVAAVILCAPASRLDRAQARLRESLVDPRVAILGLAAGLAERRARPSRASAGA